MRVLIVEDDVIYAEAVRSLLERARHTVVGIAGDTVEAHALTRTQYPDLALVDVGLRDGRTGIEIGRWLVRCGVAILFLTGSPEGVTRGIGGTLGVLAKPAGDARLLRAVEAAEVMVRRGGSRQTSLKPIEADRETQPR